MFLIFSQKKPPNFQEKDHSYFFLRKVFLIFQESYIQNLGIFRTMVYSEPKAYLRWNVFAKTAAQRTFKRQLEKNKKIHPEKSFYTSEDWSFHFLYCVESFSYISGNENPDKISYISSIKSCQYKVLLISISNDLNCLSKHFQKLLSQKVLFQNFKKLKCVILYNS